MSEEHDHKHCCCVCGCKGTEGDCGWNCEECECCELDKSNWNSWKKTHCGNSPRLYTRIRYWSDRADGITQTYVVDAENPNLYSSGAFNEEREFDTMELAEEYIVEWNEKYPRRYLQDYKCCYTEKFPSRYN